MKRQDGGEAVLIDRSRAARSKKRVNHAVKTLISETLNDYSADDFLWVSTKEYSDIPSRKTFPHISGIGNLTRMNDVRYVNKFLERANSELEEGEYLVVNAETKNSRRIRILNKYPSIISRPYYLLDFMLKRVFPKWKPTYKIYYSITKGRNRVLSLPEMLGRISSCGFKVLKYTRVGYNTWFIAQKVKEPAYDMEPTYGSLVRLKRVGKEGKLINVYKFRTMHPYSEYIQDYIFENNRLDEGGKFKNDFRITGWGKWFRKLWIDELPMMINWLKGELKIVGVRPLSRHYFGLYPEEIQELRTQVKPGLVPPFYADLPKTFEEIVESERKYIESYREKPIRTDIQYFFKAMNNILIKRARSN